METTKKVLIVDDEKFVTDVLEGFFRNKGYEILKAEDGQTSLNIIENEELDLVLLDIKLPKVDGIKILKLLRQYHPGVKVIVMTAYDIEYKTIVDNIGYDAFFIKPLLIDELTAKVEELLSQEKATMQAIKQQIEAPALDKSEAVIPQGALPKARILIVSPRGLISGLLKDYFTRKEICNGIYEVIESSTEQLERIEKFQPDIILLDVALVGTLGEFGLTLIKMPQPPKEIILFGDPAVKWEEAEALIRRGTKFIEIPQSFHDSKFPIHETVERLNSAVRDVCAKYALLTREEN